MWSSNSQMCAIARGSTCAVSEANTYSGGGKSVSGSASPSPLAPLPLLPPPAEKIPPKKSRNHPLAALRHCPPPFCLRSQI
ncbi:hypothetical protein Taro_015537 [Colocasia esculenta]|uniref:Uncharacterized protein n=1 Tax=Colocasia esculenta TaxID=4460 RepID=A0A843UMK6_COLES|nr:hypothetical protein [Colocasia esculenta]